MYSANAEGIKVQMPDGAIADVSDVSHIVRGEAVTMEEGRTYVFHPELKQYPRRLLLFLYLLFR